MIITHSSHYLIRCDTHVRFSRTIHLVAFCCMTIYRCLMHKFLYPQRFCGCFCRIVEFHRIFFIRRTESNRSLTNAFQPALRGMFPEITFKFELGVRMFLLSLAY